MIGRKESNGPQGSGLSVDKSFTLNATDHHAVCYENHANDSRVTRCEDGIVPTLSSRMGTGGGNVPFVMATGQINAEILKDKCPTLNCAHEQPIYCGKEIMQEVYSVDSKSSNSMKSNNPHSGFHLSKVIKTLDTSVPDPSKNQGGHIIMEEKAMAFAQNTRDEVRYQNGDGQIVGALAANPGMKQTTYIKTNTVVRRLTPVECERLQGFPDNYTNIPWKGKPSSPDCRRYKAIGNSMAVPVMQWIGKRMLEAKQVVCDEDAIDTILYGTPSDGGQLSLF